MTWPQQANSANLYYTQTTRVDTNAVAADQECTSQSDPIHSLQFVQHRLHMPIYVICAD